VRRAQLLSLDAMLSLIIMMFVFAAVINTSTTLKGEITSMIGWYERSNIADNMLDVLTKSPGDPVDWELGGDLKVPGLRMNGEQTLDYGKVYALFSGIEGNDEKIIKALCNLSGAKDFQVAILTGWNLDALVNYTLERESWLTVCRVKDLVNELGNPSDVPALISCPSGKVSLTHSGVPYNTYTNNRFMCVNDTLYIGDNFHVNVAEYIGIAGDLQIKSDGSLNTSELYLEGDGTIESNAEIKTTGDLNVGGELNVKDDGRVNVGGSAYIHDEVEIQSSGYLTVEGDIYAEGPLKVHQNGNVKAGGSIYVNNYVNAENSAHIEAGKSIYINGDLRSLEYNAEIKTGEELYINGKATVKGDIVTGGGMYVNGSMVIDYGSTVTVGGDLYVNGNLDVKGTLIVHGDLYINGNLVIEWNKKVTVDGALYITGQITNHGDLRTGQGVHYVNELPWDESKLNFSVTIPPMKHAPCLLGAGYNLVVSANVSITNEFRPAWFYKDWEDIAVINGTLVRGREIIEASKRRAEWIEYREKTVLIRKMVYNRTYNISPTKVPMELYAGSESHPLSPSDVLRLNLYGEGNITIISVFVQGTSWGYSVMTFIREDSNTYYVAKMRVITGNKTVERECGDIHVLGDEVIIPWKCLIPQPSLRTPVRFSVSIRELKGFRSVLVEDLSSLGVYLKPTYTSSRIKVWVWDEP